MKKLLSIVALTSFLATASTNCMKSEKLSIIKMIDRVEKIKKFYQKKYLIKQILNESNNEIIRLQSFSTIDNPLFSAFIHLIYKKSIDDIKKIKKIYNRKYCTQAKYSKNI